MASAQVYGHNQFRKKLQRPKVTFAVKNPLGFHVDTWLKFLAGTPMWKTRRSYSGVKCMFLQTFVRQVPIICMCLCVPYCFNTHTYI